MTPEVGHFALALALALALVQSILPMIGASRRNLIWMRSARATRTGQLVLLGIAFAALAYSFLCLILR